ncbi:MAG: hypothetical protein ABIA37_03570 [Candidatus Woesearchaeota archaeon]
MSQYKPRTALIVMKEEDELLAYFIENRLRSMLEIDEIYHTSSDVESMGFLNKYPGPIDLLVVGQGMEAVANYQESRSLSQGTYTVAVSQNGVRADLKLPENRNLESLVRNSPETLLHLYQTNLDAQQARAEEEYI